MLINKCTCHRLARCGGLFGPHSKHLPGNFWMKRAASRSLEESRATDQRPRAGMESLTAPFMSGGTRGPIMLVLVGSPGSGKSTFARSLQLNNPIVWDRANQDELKTRKKCEQRVREALTARHCVVVDRCNFDDSQRLTWIELAAQFSIPCCALWLAQPANVAANRAASRRTHEGGVTGPQARAVSYRIDRQTVGPSPEEGFHHITVARNDAEAAAALTAWRSYGPSTLEQVLAALEQVEARSRLGPWGNLPGAAALGGRSTPQAGGVNAAQPAAVPPRMGRAGGARGWAAAVPPTTWGGAATAGWTGASQQAMAWGGGAAAGMATTAAVPEASAGTRAATAARTDVSLQAMAGGGSLLAGTASAGSPAAAGRGAATAGRIDVAQQALGRGGGASAGRADALQSAVVDLTRDDDAQHVDTHKVHYPSSPARPNAFAVLMSGAHRTAAPPLPAGPSLPSSRQLHPPHHTPRKAQQNVGCHAARDAHQPLPSNGHDAAPPLEANGVLCSSNSSAAAAESSLTQNRIAADASAAVPQTNTATAVNIAQASMPGPELADPLASSSAVGSHQPASAAAAHPIAGEPGTRADAVAAAPSTSAAPQIAADAPIRSAYEQKWSKSGRWSAEFTHWIRDVDKFRAEQPNLYLNHDDRVLLVRDGYPKARLHLLVIALDQQLLDMSCLRLCHLPLLRHMKQVALKWVSANVNDLGTVGVAMGFHWIPSMRQLHLHVISRDFVSDCLKRPDHWRTFTTAFFRPVDDVIQEIESLGRALVDIPAAEALLKGPLRCHRCLAQQSNLPALKRHILVCTAEVQRPSLVSAGHDAACPDDMAADA